MKRLFITVLIVMAVGGGMLWTCTENVLAKEKDTIDRISPDSPLYFLDRLVEKLTVIILPDDKKVNFHLKVSRERFNEAILMHKAGKADKASKLFNEGLENIGDALASWKRCVEKEIDLSGIKEDLQLVIAEAKTTFNQLRKELKPEKIADFLKEIAKLTKAQIEVMLKK